jgi:ribosome-binding ATPase YchF (GTP1/OBG family)
MKIALVGYQGSGKSTFFEWLSGVAADPALAHTTQSASVPVPDDRIPQLCEIYKPKKVTMASLDLVDTPGLGRDHQGNPARLATLREAGCLVLVVAGFDGADPASDLTSFEEDLMLADMEIVTGRIERLRESVKKPRPNREEEMAELAALEPILAAMEAGTPLQESQLNESQRRATRSFQLLSGKPRMIAINLSDDEEHPERLLQKMPSSIRAVAVTARLQQELARMEESERRDFAQEMGVAIQDRGEILRRMLHSSGQHLYFTAGEKEVRSWMLRQGGTALEAADNIHSDLARGFIRCETMSCEDLLRLGSERDVKANNLMRQEPKDYVIKDGDIINIKFSV